MINLKQYLPDQGIRIKFLILWILVGFTEGTIILMFPVRWGANFFRANQWSESIEKFYVLLWILVLVISSYYFIWKYLIKWTSNELPRCCRILSWVIVVELAGLALWGWFTPSLMAGSGEEIEDAQLGDVQFHFGPYPEEDRLMKLKAEGYTGVISLLHEAVVPFEPVLLSDEKEECGELGVQLIHMPMLPWLSDNKHISDGLKELLAKGKGKYYVHCYLGRDRVNVFKRLLQQAIDSSGVKAKLEHLDGSGDVSSTQALNVEKFERGILHQFNENVVLGPMPTDEEFMAFVLNSGKFKTVINLMDPKNPDDLPWIDKERVLMTQSGIKFINWPMPDEDELDVILQFFESWEEVEQPVYVHAFLSPSNDFRAFKKGYDAKFNK